MQSKNKSRLESLCNFITAFLVGVLVTIVGIDVAIDNPVLFVLILNILSTLRHYIWRRVFALYID